MSDLDNNIKQSIIQGNAQLVLDLRRKKYIGIELVLYKSY